MWGYDSGIPLKWLAVRAILPDLSDGEADRARGRVTDAVTRGPPVLTTIIGRGHSGTRAMSHTLSASGVWMGEPLNGSGDLLPPQAMYVPSHRHGVPVSMRRTNVRYLA